MQIRNKYLFILIISLLLSTWTVFCFVLGFYVGESKIKNKKQKTFFIKFFQSDKNVGKEITKDEKKGLRYFIVPYEECLSSSLDSDEKKQLKVIQNEVINLSKDNNFVKFNINDLNSTNNQKVLIKKVKKCQKYAYNNMTKDNKKNMKKAIKKMNVINIISIFHGIK